MKNVRKNKREAQALMDKMQKVATATGIVMTLRIIKSICDNAEKTDEEKLYEISAFVDSSYDALKSGHENTDKKAVVSP